MPELRIIGGTWRSRRLKFPAVPGLRPTPDRARETLFNWLGQDLSNRDCLDLFAGSGALGFEAASRGARVVLMVERDRRIVTALNASAAVLGAGQVRIVQADVLEFICAPQQKFDVAFLDPPYQSDFSSRTLRALPRLLRPNALVYCEAADQIDVPLAFERLRQRRYGQVWLTLLRFNGER